MNSILAKLERKFQDDSALVLSVDGLDADSGQGRGAESHGHDLPVVGIDIAPAPEGGKLPKAETDSLPSTDKSRLPSTWRESASVTYLSKFMNEYQSSGFSLCAGEAGGVAIHISPGVSPADLERWDLALHAEHLLREAFPDLKHLLRIGSFTLKKLKGHGEAMKIPELTPYEKICCTSVSDGVATLKDETRVSVVRRALLYEKRHAKRATMVKAIEARLRKLER